jgi:hypothetical protein
LVKAKPSTSPGVFVPRQEVNAEEDTMPGHVRRRRFSHHKRPEGGYYYERLAREDPERLLEIAAKAGRASVRRQGVVPIVIRLNAARAAKRAAQAAQ